MWALLAGDKLQEQNVRPTGLVKEAILRLNYSREKAESKTANQLRYELKQLKDQVKEEEVESSGLPRGLEKLQCSSYCSTCSPRTRVSHASEPCCPVQRAEYPHTRRHFPLAFRSTP